MLIYKVFRAAEWAEMQRFGETPGAPVDRADGYVHFSTAGQLAETLSKHFKGDQELTLLTCDSYVMGDALRWEPSRDGALFPHLYRPLRMDDVLETRAISLVNGVHDIGDLS